MQKASLLQRAQDAAPSFKRPDTASFVPSGQEDAVQRVVAAGMRLMYADEMREEVNQALQSSEDPGKVLGDNVTGLILTLDQKAQGGIPEQAIFPAGVELLGEAAEMMIAAGMKVSQDHYADAVRVLLINLARKMGASDDQILQATQAQAMKAGGEPMGEEGPAEEMQ